MSVSMVLEVEGVDVTSFLVDNIRFDGTASRIVPSGFFSLDNDNSFSISYGDEVSFYVSVDSNIKHFGGYINSISNDKTGFKTFFEVKGFANKALLTEYTGRFRSFRDDQGTGNMKDILLSIVVEKFPDWTYDDISVPDIDYDFVTKSFQDVRVSDIFDEFARLVGREWFVDNDKKFFFVKRTFSDVVSVVSNDNIVGRVIEDVDDSRFANIVKVRGARFPVHIKEEFLAGGTDQEFLLANFPNSSTQVQYSSGTQVDTVLEGSDDYSTGSVHDAYFKPDIPSLKFNVNTFAGGTVQVLYNIVSFIREEIPSAASIESVGFEKVKRFDDEKIATQQEAFDIASAYISAYSSVVKVYTVNVFPISQQELEDFFYGNNLRLIVGGVDDSFNVVGASYSWSKSNGFLLTLRLNDVPEGDDERITSLLKRISQRDDKEFSSGATIVKTFYWGGNVYVDIENIGLEVQATDDTFLMQDSHVPPDWRSLMGGTSIMRDDFTTSPVISLVQNSSNTFRERFIDSFYIDSSSSGTLNRDAQDYTLDPGGTLLSRDIVRDGVSISSVTLSVTGGTTFDLAFKNDNTSWESGTVDEAHVFGVSGEGVLYRIVNSGGGTISFSLIEGVYS